MADARAGRLGSGPAEAKCLRNCITKFILTKCLIQYKKSNRKCTSFSCLAHMGKFGFTEVKWYTPIFKKLTEMFVWSLLSHMSVSYTHLDVYKRQVVSIIET